MTEKNVNLAKMVTPKFLTLTGMPANQTAFKVIRDDGEKPMSMQHVQRRRTRRSDSLVSITFEEGMDEAGAKAVLEAWGIEEYTLDASGDRLKAAMRADPGNTMSVNIGEGRSATVLKPISNSTSDTEKSNIAVARIDFAKDSFPEMEDVTDWLKRNDIDSTKVTFELSDTATIVHRSTTKEVDVRSITVETGVNFAVIRADVVDVPVNFVTVVSDTAYGNWGWGQLDFAATMADREFCDVARDALYALEGVMDRIIFYSDVPVSVRKDLVRSAAMQYADYVAALMDALPSKVVVAIRSSSAKEKPMNTAPTQSGQPAARTDAPAPAAVTTPAVVTPDPAATTAPAADAALTRSDVEALIAGAVGGISAQIAALTAAVSRTDAVAPAAEAAAPVEPAAAAPTLADVMRSVQELASSVKVLESGTVVRSDSGDEKGGTKDVFRGMFGGQRKS